MNKSFIIFLIFLSSTTLFSQEEGRNSLRKIQGSKEMPIEVNLLVESLSDTIGYQKFLSNILNIDSYARVLNKEDVFLIGKIEIYKTLLKSSANFPKAAIDANATNKLADAIKKSRDPFVKWFLKALLADCEALMGSANYKNYLLQKNSGRLEGVEFKKIDKKVKLLYRWINKINPDSPDFEGLLTSELAPVMMDSLANLERSFFMMASQTQNNSTLALIKSPNELKFFSLKEIKAAQKPKVVDKSVEDILSPITDENRIMEPALPKPSNEDWINEDNAPLNLKNLPKPTDDADWLQDF